MNCMVIGLSDASVLAIRRALIAHYHMSPMCRMACITRASKNRRVDRNGGSKIKGNGTSVPLRHCLHIGFRGTRIFRSVPSNT